MAARAPLPDRLALFAKSTTGTQITSAGGVPTPSPREVRPMCPLRRYPSLAVLFSPCRRSQQQTLTLVIAAMAERAQASSVAVAGHLAVELGTPLGRALTRCYRLRRSRARVGIPYVAKLARPARLTALSHLATSARWA